jgi:hypothetical protein
MQFYKGKTSFTELAGLPCHWFYRLYGNLMRKLSTEEGRKELGATLASDQLEEGFGG